MFGNKAQSENTEKCACVYARVHARMRACVQVYVCKNERKERKVSVFNSSHVLSIWRTLLFHTANGEYTLYSIQSCSRKKKNGTHMYSHVRET